MSAPAPDELYRRVGAAVRILTDPEQYRAVYALTEGTHPCQVGGCPLSQEEHHRLAYGIMAENAELRRKLQR